MPAPRPRIPRPEAANHTVGEVTVFGGQVAVMAAPAPLVMTAPAPLVRGVLADAPSFQVAFVFLAPVAVMAAATAAATPQDTPAFLASTARRTPPVLELS
ncbi:hypothetical protein ACFVT1_10680 [Streptomyces sp. NPDC057963]|uniref:hypothetical protein n=1 Tax=Streptomyces sp. NPDC057963 TaxID=3346290 RepID=UPI0036E6FD25